MFVINGLFQCNYQTCTWCKNLSDDGGFRNKQFICLDCLEIDDKRKSDLYANSTLDGRKKI